MPFVFGTCLQRVCFSDFTKGHFLGKLLDLPLIFFSKISGIGRLCLTSLFAPTCATFFFQTLHHTAAAVGIALGRLQLEASGSMATDFLLDLAFLMFFGPFWTNFWTNCNQTETGIFQDELFPIVPGGLVYDRSSNHGGGSFLSALEESLGGRIVCFFCASKM